MLLQSVLGWEASITNSATVRFRAKDESWEVLGDERRGNDSGSLTLCVDELKLIRAADLRRALASAASFYAGVDEGVQITKVPAEYADYDSPWSESSFELSEAQNSLFLIIQEWDEIVNPKEPELEYIERAHRLLTPLVRRYRMWVDSIELSEDSDFPLIGYTVRLGFHPRGRALGDVYVIGQSALELLRAAKSGSLTRHALADLVRGGHVNLLEGQDENDWFDAKVDHYDLKHLNGKISLASAVARFANSELGGVIVVGAKTKRTPSGEVVSVVNGVPYDKSMAPRYLAILNQYLYPPPDFLTLDLVRLENVDNMVVLIDVPPQPEELKPFLVHGAIVGHRIEGSFISIVRRRGEGSIPITAPMIHSTLAAGRALLRSESPSRTTHDQ